MKGIIAADRLNVKDPEMRAVYAATLEKLIQKDSKVVALDADLMRAIGTFGLLEKYPDNLFDCGIAEANMVGVAAGLSTEGFIPFVHSFGCFVARRALDQIFMSCAYAKQNVKIIGSDPGVVAALNGGTHTPNEDIAALRAIPEMTIIDMCDSVMAAELLPQIAETYGTFFIRYPRTSIPRVYDEKMHFKLGEAVTLREGEDLTIIVDGVQGRFRTTNWYITAAVTLLSGILAYFVSGRALKPLRSFASQVEQVQLNNLADMRIDEDAISEFRQLSRSFNQMLERLNNAFAAQRQFTGNAAHELRTPLALMQAQLELFSAEHPDVRPETAEFLTLLREQTERLTQMTKTLLEMSNLQQVARNEQLQLAPMVEEIFTDLAPLAEKRSISLEAEGDAALTGSDALIYRLLFNLTENAVKYNRPGGSVRVELTQGQEKCIIRVSDTGCGIPEKYQQSIFQPFFRVDKSRSREYGGAGLGLSLVWEIADLHGGSVWVEKSSDKGTTIAVELPAGAESDSLSADIP